MLAIGELNVDLVLTGLKSMPVPGREIIAEDIKLVLGSSTAICAAGMAKLGLQVGFIGKLGKDSYGSVVKEGLSQYGVDLSMIMEEEKLSTGITVSLSTQTDRALVTCLGSINALRAEDVDIKKLEGVSHIHVGSFFLQSALRPGLKGLFKKARELGITTSLDAGWDDTNNWDYGIMDVLKYTDFFFPNESEALNITHTESVPAAAAKLSEYCNTVVVKMGPQGAYLKTGPIILQKPPYDTVPIDTTGAGDSFNAGFIYAFINRLDFSTCLNYANACGSISITRIGGATSCPGLDEVKRLIKNGSTAKRSSL